MHDNEVNKNTTEDQDIRTYEHTTQKMLEALLLVIDEEASTEELAAAVERPVTEVEEILRSLFMELREQDRGWQLRHSEKGWKLYTAKEVSDVIANFYQEGQQQRLSQAALETLTIIAYRQPISRPRISSIRGVNVDAVMKTLLMRRLIEETGQDQTTGALLYQTTSLFLELLGISRLDELPAVVDYLPAFDVLDDILEEMPHE